MLFIPNVRDIFVTKSTGTSFRKFFLRMTQVGTAFRNPFFPGIGITNTTPLRRNFGSLFAPGTFLKRKIALLNRYPELSKIKYFL